MRTDHEPGERTGRHGWLRLAAGPLLTLLFAAACEALRPTPFRIPGPGVTFTLFVVWSSFVGGRAPGLASAVIAAGYLAWFNATSTSPLAWRGGDLTHVRILWVALPALAWMTGLLRERAVRAAARGRADRDLRELLEQSPSSVLLADDSGRFTYANARALELTGYPPGELLGMTMAGLAVPGAAVAPPPAGAGADGVTHATRVLRRRDGTTFVADVAARRLPDGRTLADVRDVTAGHEAIARLEHALSALRATFEATAEGIVVVDASGVWQSWNQQFMRMWDSPPVVTREEGLEAVRRHTASMLADPEKFVERLREIYANPEAESFDELRFRDGRIVERVSKPQRIAGACVGRVWSFRDVTEARRQAAALRESEARLLQAQKFEALGRLAGGVAHDFNNMLTAILGETELLLGGLPEGGEARAAAGRIRGAAERSARLTRQLLMFSRHRRQDAVEVDLRQLLVEVEPILRSLAGTGCELRVWSPGAGAVADLRVRADATALEQAVLNLVVNAYDAMPGGGVVDVRLFREAVPGDDAIRRGGTCGGDYACIEVADTGPGVAPEILPHLFEPFFTTKPRGKGTGLGLASVHGAVFDAGGFVEVESRQGHGALFRLMLPALAGPPRDATSAPGPAAAVAAAGAAVVLLAEDEDAVRAFARTVLRREGFHVVETANAAEAIAAFEALPEPPALLLTDVRMPGLSGVELARRLRGLSPGLPVLLMSGWPGEAAEELESVGMTMALLAKPFAGAELVAAVRAEIAAPPPPDPGRETLRAG